MKKTIFLISLICCSVCFSANYARTLPLSCVNHSTQFRNFHQAFKQLMEEWNVLGASVAIMKNDKIILACGYGWKNVEKRQKIQPNTLFRIGSVSKTITALAVLQLVQENRLNLNDKVFSILSELKPLNHQKSDPSIQSITVRNLLEMSSGWYQDRPQDYDPLFGPWSDQMLSDLNQQVPPDCEIAARLMMSHPLDFKPGSQFSYSNINYCLLGLVINKVNQQHGFSGYESYVKTHLLAPYDIMDMQIGSTQKTKQNPNEATYYSLDSNRLSDIDRILDGLPYSDSELLQKNYADGGWIASSIDLVKILNAFYANRIIHQNMKAFMFSHFGMGWDVFKIENNHRVLIKTGTFTGSKAFVMLSDHGYAYAVLLNSLPDTKDNIQQKLKIILESSNADLFK